MPASVAPAVDHAERDAAVLSIYRWVALLSNRWARHHRLDVDDVLQHALAVVLESFAKYDPARGSLTEWAKFRVRAAAQQLRDRRRKHSREVQLVGSPVGGDDFGLLGWVPDHRPDPAEHLGVAEAVGDALGRLPDRQRRAVESRYGLDGQGGRGLREMAPEFRCSRTRVGQILAGARRRLREDRALREAVA